MTIHKTTKMMMIRMIYVCIDLEINLTCEMILFNLSYTLIYNVAHKCHQSGIIISEVANEPITVRTVLKLTFNHLKRLLYCSFEGGGG